ncbi:mRNA-capping enzyme subunit beta, partial [Cryomyces antarcticus]
KQHAVRYEHRYERDTFQEFSSAGVSSLPANIQRNLNPAHRAKIRTTTNTKTGEQIAKILKARLADLHIYSPSTEFDYRISVSLEYAVPDALAALVVDPDVPGARVVQKQPARIKDRLSYSHLSTYLMDLTQVTDGSSGEKTHEMEIELDVVELRKHAALLESGAEDRYEKVVKGLLDNCFILARAATEAQT